MVLKLSCRFVPASPSKSAASEEAMENLLEHVFRNVLGVEQEARASPGDGARGDSRAIIVKYCCVSSMGSDLPSEDLPCLIADTMPLGQSRSDCAQMHTDAHRCTQMHAGAHRFCKPFQVPMRHVNG